MIPGSANPLLLKSAAAAGAYQIERSLRFNSSDSGFCSRTPAVAGNRTTWTWSAWVKRASLSTGNDQFLFSGGTTNSNTGFMAFYFDANHKLTLGTATTNILISTAVFRDVSAWAHVLIAFDATNGTNANKAKIYVNGTEITTFDTDNRSGVSNQDYGINQAALHEIGRSCFNSARYFDGYLADIHFIDGQALTPSSFTEVSATTGQLIPLAYSGSFGTNGFWLKFSDNSAATAATLGKDYSGNSNNWTPNNLSVTAGAGNDSLVDTPTSYGTDTGVGGEVRGNYATLNPLANGATLSNGNLDITGPASGYGGSISTIALDSGKYYWEYTVTNNYVQAVICGISARTVAPFSSLSSADEVYYQNNYVVTNGSTTSGLNTIVAGDVIGITWDGSSNQIKFYRNNSLQTTVTASSGKTYFAGFGGIVNNTASINFGQRAFAYTAPSGFKALCDTNLPAPLTAKPNTVMDVVLYTGTGAALTPTSSLGFNPDWIWIKSRSAATDHALYDVVRGAQARLESNTTDAEVTTDGGVTAFNSAGFTLGTLAQVNTSSATYVGWAWDAGTSTDPSNTAGSITSQVRANVSAGFSVVTYVSNGTNNTSVGHGLNVKPALVIQKDRTSASDWLVLTQLIDGSDDYLLLNSTAAAGNAAAGMTSTIFGSWDRSNGNNMVAYCFAPVVGYSSALAWTGNGSADGPLLHCGFSPRFWIFKRTDTTGDWWMIDTARSNTGNPVDEWLAANRSDAEYPNDGDFDFLSNGIKIRTTSTSVNASGGSYIGFAWASNPFQYARAQ